jgi:hypothetical protein
MKKSIAVSVFLFSVHTVMSMNFFSLDPFVQNLCLDYFDNYSLAGRLNSPSPSRPDSSSSNHLKFSPVNSSEFSFLNLLEIPPVSDPRLTSSSSCVTIEQGVLDSFLAKLKEGELKRIFLQTFTNELTAKNYNLEREKAHLKKENADLKKKNEELRKNSGINKKKRNNNQRDLKKNILLQTNRRKQIQQEKKKKTI